MKWTRLFGLVFLAMLWFWLVKALFASAGGFNAKNIFLAIASAIIIFVPLYKKYFHVNNSDKK